MAKWEIPKIIDEPPFIVDSTQFYDNKKDPYTTPRDRKNMRIRGESITKSIPDNNNGGGDADNGNSEEEIEGYTLKIDPDRTNQLENRQNGLYVPPVTWENLK